MKLLIVEDDREFAQMVKYLFGQENFITRIDVANNLREAMNYVYDIYYDAILTDYDLGFGNTGIDVIRYAKEFQDPITILWSSIDRLNEINNTYENHRPDWTFMKWEHQNVIQQLRVINDELNEKVIK